jgi:hypothetical protein
LTGPYQLRVGVPLVDVRVLLVDLREVVVDRECEQRVPVSPHQEHLDVVSGVKLLPGDGDDAENG